VTGEGSGRPPLYGTITSSGVTTRIAIDHPLRLQNSSWKGFVVGKTEFCGKMMRHFSDHRPTVYLAIFIESSSWEEKMLLMINLDTFYKRPTIVGLRRIFVDEKDFSIR
jgi:hypothetical protein